MFEKKVDGTELQLDQTIRNAEADLQSMDTGSEEYAKALAHVERLYKLKEKHSRRRVDPNTWVLVAGNLAGILAILTYEHGRVVTSKALSFAGKLR